mmetsp:Transcript_2510/g.5756  ORF Transcript_2510/g.5756 Transcript_2510/m.5756 type:complete len:160 (-) Transcript_2510:802-1281(-)
MSDPSFLEHFGPTIEDLSKLSWKTINTTMSTPHDACAATVIEMQLWVFGGYPNTLSSVEAYNAENDTWKTQPQMPTGRHNCAAVSIDHKIYVFGGNVKGCVEMFDLHTQKWTSLPSKNTLGLGLCAAKLDEYIHHCGWRKRNQWIQRCCIVQPNHPAMD